MIDRCLRITSKAICSQLRLSTIILTIVSGPASAALAGYWIYWIDDTLVSEEYSDLTGYFEY